jgi:hypothetical protein
MLKAPYDIPKASGQKLGSAETWALKWVAWMKTLRDPSNGWQMGVNRQDTV